MKKAIFTLMVALGIFSMANAQMLVDFEEVSGTLGGWCDDNGVVANPASGGENTTDSTSWFTCTPTNWSAAQIDFDGQELGDYTGIEFLVYVDNAGDGVKLGEIAFGGFAGKTDPEKAVITESNTWIKMEYEIDGAASTDVINQFFAKVNGAGSDAINIYFDQIKLNEYTFTPPQQDPAEVVTIGYASGDMEIDGKDIEDDYDNAGVGEILKVTDGSDASGFEGEFAMLWDEDYLYMFFAISDAEVNLWDQDGWAEWKADGMQLYLDPLNRRFTGMAAGVTGGAVNPGRETQEAIDAGSGFQTSYELRNMGGFLPELMQGSEVAGSGYTIECAWSWKAIANTVMDSADVYAWVEENIKSGFKFSFDIQLNNNTGGDRVNVLSWAHPNGPYGDSGQWGEVTLEGGGTSSKRDAVKAVAVYPNPAIDVIKVDMANIATIEVYNLIGSKMIETNKAYVNVAELNAGVYVLQVTNTNGEVAVSKFNKR